MKKITPISKGKASATPEDEPGKEWNWEHEINDACMVLEAVQQQLLAVGLGAIEAVNEHALARVLGMVRGRLRDMTEGKPFAPIPGEMY